MSWLYDFKPLEGDWRLVAFDAWADLRLIYSNLDLFKYKQKKEFDIKSNSFLIDRNRMILAVREGIE